MFRRLFVLFFVAALWAQPSVVSAQLPNGSKVMAAWQKLRKARINRNGENPQRERPPLTKPLNDPSNFEEGTPEIIKKAAEVKKAEDAKVQKIKAIKYLTSIGCACYDLDDSITEALIEAAKDCTEEVRLQTVESVMGAACAEKCKQCGTGCCCKEALLMQLYKMAYERDDKGNYLEPSARVRAAAKKALKACCPGTGPVPILEPEPDETQEKDETTDRVEDETLPDELPDTIEPSVEEEPTVEPSDIRDPNGKDTPSEEGAEREVLRNHRPDELGYPLGKTNQNSVEHGVVIDVDRDLRIAHVHFENESLQFSKGAKLMAVVQREGKNYWIGPLTVYKSFLGSAHVTAPAEMTWSEIQKGTPIISTTTQANRSRDTQQFHLGAQPRSAAPAPRRSTAVADISSSALILPSARIRR